jgi:hypothetical protein
LGAGIVTLQKSYFFSHEPTSYSKLQLVNFDGEVRTAQLTLIAGNASIRVGHLDDKGIHLQNLGGAEFNTDAAPFAVSFDDFDFRFRAHERLSPLIRNCCRRQPDQSGGILSQVTVTRQKILTFQSPATPPTSISLQRQREQKIGSFKITNLVAK